MFLICISVSHFALSLLKNKINYENKNKNSKYMLAAFVSFSKTFTFRPNVLDNIFTTDKGIFLLSSILRGYSAGDHFFANVRRSEIW